MRRGAWRGLVALAAGLRLLVAPGDAAADFVETWLERAEDALRVRSPDGFWEADLRGWVDFELYTIDQRPPGLLQSRGNPLVAPRLSMLASGRVGRQLEIVTLARVDRGFDPTDGGPEARADEYFLTWTPLESPALNVRVGKFATVFGAWVPRHLSWENPLINAPLPYDDVTTVSDMSVPADPAAFLARKGQPDEKTKWVPMIWGPSYTSGASLFGRWQWLDWAGEVSNRPLSSRPSTWGLADEGFEHPAFTGRLGARPTPAWTLGVSGSFGPYLENVPGSALPSGTSIGDFWQVVYGGDLGWAHGPWQVWSEILYSDFDVPNVGHAGVLSYYVEGKRKLGSRFWLAGRWNQQFYGDVSNGRGGEARWDDDLWRIDVALGLRVNRFLQGKLQYSFNHQTGPLQQGPQMVAVQVTLRF